jgi:hypothetical protein
MWWKRVICSFALIPGSHAFGASDQAFKQPHQQDAPKAVSSLAARQDRKCQKGTMSGSDYCDTCDGWTLAIPNTFVKCQDPVDKTTDDQNNAYQEMNGECRVYADHDPALSAREQEKCQSWCKSQNIEVQDGSTNLCNGFQPATGDPALDNNFFFTFRDAGGKYYEFAQCACDVQLPGLIMDIVLEGIAEAMDAIAEILFVGCRLFAGALELV